VARARWLGNNDRNTRAGGHQGATDRFNLVGKNYFQIFNYGLLRGRTFSDEELAGQRKVIGVNEAFAQKFFSKSDPLGQRVDFLEHDESPQQARETTAEPAAHAKPPAQTYFEIVGVVSNVRGSGIEQQVQPAAFLPCTIAPQFVSSIDIRTTRDADEFSGAIARQVWAMDHDITLSNDRGSLDSNLQKYDYAQPEFEFIVLSLFGGIGMLLVIIGVYSVHGLQRVAANARDRYSYGLGRTARRCSPGSASQRHGAHRNGRSLRPFPGLGGDSPNSEPAVAS